MTCLVTMVNKHGRQTSFTVKFKPDLRNFKEFSIKKVLQDYMEGQEQQAHLKNKTDVLSCFDLLREHTHWNKARGIKHATLSSHFNQEQQLL